MTFSYLLRSGINVHLPIAVSLVAMQVLSSQKVFRDQKKFIDSN